MISAFYYLLKLSLYDGSNVAFDWAFMCEYD